MLCSVCGGNGRPISGLACVCNGRGTLVAETDGLRSQLFDALQEIAMLRKLAYTDELTGLDNERAILKYAEEHPGGAWIVIDLDGFKDYQDQCGGHSAGDKVLCDFADYLRRNTRGINDIYQTRPNDVVAARLHGDEFAIYIAPKSNLHAARERLLGMIGEWSAGSLIVVRASAGFGFSLEDADAAMYETKRSR